MLRLFESTGSPADVLLTFPGPLRFCEETNHIEQSIEGGAHYLGPRGDSRPTVTVDGDKAAVHMRPNEIKTLRFALEMQSLGLPATRQEEEAALGISGPGV